MWLLLLLALAAGYFIGRSVGRSETHERWNRALEDSRRRVEAVSSPEYSGILADGVPEDHADPVVFCPGCREWSPVRQEPAAPLIGSLTCCEWPVERRGDVALGMTLWEPLYNSDHDGGFYDVDPEASPA